MQNQTQYLLEKLQTNQSRCHQLLDTSLSSISGAGLKSSVKNNKSSHVSQHGLSDMQLAQEAGYGKGSQQSRAALASRIQKQKLLSHLQIKSKLAHYKKVTDGNVPENHSGPRLKQGIENDRFLFGDYSVGNNGIVMNWNGVEKPQDGDRTVENDDYGPLLGEDELMDQERVNSSVTFQDELELLGSGNASFSGTVKSAGKAMSETPRSILKHRKIINDNVKVDLECAHTPIKLVTPKSKHGLNYSYASTDDSMISSKLPGHECNSLNGSYVKECLGSGNSVTDKVVGGNDESLCELDKLIKERLLLDEGNDRTNASLVRDLSKRPKSYIFQSAEDLDDKQTKHTNAETPLKV